MEDYRDSLEPNFNFKQNISNDVEGTLFLGLQDQQGEYTLAQKCLGPEFTESSGTDHGQNTLSEGSEPKLVTNDIQLYPRKPSLTKSWLFKKGYGERVLKDNVIMIRCCIEGCGRIYKANKGSTSSISYHLLSAHNISEFPGVPGSGPLKPSQVKKLLRPKTKQIQQENSLVCASAFQFKKPEVLPCNISSQTQENHFKGCIPFPVIQDKYLLDFLQLSDTCLTNVSLLPTDIRPSQYIDPNFQDYKRKLKQVLKQQSSISLSLNHFKDALFITAHFIDDKWTTKEVVLSIISLKDGVIASELANLLVDTLADFHITDKVFTITTDLSPTMLLLMEGLLHNAFELGPPTYHHIPCLGHVINEVVNGVLQVDLSNLPLEPKAAIDALKDVGGMASGSILDRLSFLRKGMAAIRLCFKKLSAYQRHFKHEGLSYQEPLSDIPGDWESTYAMVECAISVHKPYNFVCTIFDLGHLVISQDHLAFFDDIKAFLALFQAFSARISTTRYPSLTMATVMRDRLLKHLQSVAPQKPAHIRQAYEFSHRAFAAYYSQGFATEIYPIAMALDPRLKLSYWCPPVCSHAEAEVLRAQVKAYWEKNSDASLSQSIALPPPSGYEDVFDIDSGMTSDELIRYSQESVINTGFCSEAEVLEFWKRSCLSFPHLSKIAQKFLAIPISSNPCEKRHVHSRQETSSTFAATPETFKLKSKFSLVNTWRNVLENYSS